MHFLIEGSASTGSSGREDESDVWICFREGLRVAVEGGVEEGGAEGDAGGAEAMEKDDGMGMRSSRAYDEGGGMRGLRVVELCVGHMGHDLIADSSLI